MCVWVSGCEWQRWGWREVVVLGERKVIEERVKNGKNGETRKDGRKKERKQREMQRI